MHEHDENCTPFTCYLRYFEKVYLYAENGIRLKELWSEEEWNRLRTEEPEKFQNFLQDLLDAIAEGW